MLPAPSAPSQGPDATSGAQAAPAAAAAAAAVAVPTTSAAVPGSATLLREPLRSAIPLQPPFQTTPQRLVPAEALVPARPAPARGSVSLQEQETATGSLQVSRAEVEWSLWGLFCSC